VPRAVRAGAEKKQAVELKAVEVEIYEYKLREIEGSIARFFIECSSGTYIRSLAHEMGRRSGGGAHLSEITRTGGRRIFAGASDHASRNLRKPSWPANSRTA